MSRKLARIFAEIRSIIFKKHFFSSSCLLFQKLKRIINIGKKSWVRVHFKISENWRQFAAIFFILLFSIPASGLSQTLTSAGDALQTMNLPAGAKASALGGAFSAWADDPSAVYWNPAGMVWLPKIEMQTAFNQWFQDSFFQDLGGVWPADFGAVGARLSYVNLGSISGRDQFGNTNGIIISPEDWGGTFAAAGRLGKFSVGLAVKTYFELLSTYYNYGGVGLDAGGMYRWGTLGLAAGVRNIGLVTGYSFPTEFYTGASLALGPKAVLFRLATDATFTDGGSIIHHGLEVGFQNTVFLRAGYQWIAQPMPDQDQAGISGGAGIAVGDLNLDYAIVSYGDLGLTNQVSLMYQFTLPSAVIETEEASDARVSTISKPQAKKISGLKTGSPSQPIQTAAMPASTVLPTATTVGGITLSMKDIYLEGIAAYKNRNYEKAADLLKKALTISPAENIYLSEANAMLGVIYQYYLKTSGHLDLARYYYQAALQIDPTNTTAQKHLPQLEPNSER